eukprot:705420_1
MSSQFLFSFFNPLSDSHCRTEKAKTRVFESNITMAIKRYSLSRLQQFLYIGLTIGALLSFIISNMIDTTTHILLAPVDTELNATAMETHLHAVSYINASIVTPQEDTVMETQSEPNSSVVNSEEVTTMNIQSASNVSNSSTDTT